MIQTHRNRWRYLVFLALAMTCCWCVTLQISHAQQGPTPESGSDDDPSSGNDEEPADLPDETQQEGLNLLVLLIEGGWFMLPLGGLSVLVVAISIERLLALRRSKVMPHPLVSELGSLSLAEGGFDPREAFRISTRYPSAASNVIRSMLMKVGRPQSEVENAVTESSQREADRMHFNVRWLTLAAAVSPLVGLLGTVWGMIDAFYQTTQLIEGQDKAEQLANGIYTALITTLCGLVIAIPAAIFAQFCESRITSLFHQIDEMVFNLLPQVERFEGRVRFSRNIENDLESAGQPPSQPREAGRPPAPPPNPTTTNPTPTAARETS